MESEVLTVKVAALWTLLRDVHNQGTNSKLKSARADNLRNQAVKMRELAGMSDLLADCLDEEHKEKHRKIAEVNRKDITKSCWQGWKDRQCECGNTKTTFNNCCEICSWNTNKLRNYV